MGPDDPDSRHLMPCSGYSSTVGFRYPATASAADRYSSVTRRGGTGIGCVKRETAYLSVGDTLTRSRGGDPGKGTPSHEGSYAGEQGKVQRSVVGDAGADGSGEGPGVPAGDPGRRGHGVSGRPGEVAAQGDGRGRAPGIPQRVRQAAEPDVERRDRPGAAAPGARRGGTLREPGSAVVRAADEGGGRAGAATVPARPGGGGLRAGAAGPVGRGDAAVEVHGAPPAAEVGRGARRVGAALA